MVAPLYKESISIPEGVQVTVKPDGAIAVKGKNGELKRVMYHPDIKISTEGKAIVINAEFPRRKTRALAGTFAAHIRNMVKGAQQDYAYAMKIVYSHFPIKTKAQGEWFTIENFLGEKTARKARILPGVKVKATAEEVTVTGADVEAVSQTAANIEQACRIRGYDPRVFQDGIYITGKGA